MASRLFPRTTVRAAAEIIVEAGDLAVWFLFKGQPFDVGLIYDDAGRFRGYYADALEPVSWSGSDPATLRPLTDLFLDLWVWPAGRYAVLDEEELEQAEAARFITGSQSAAARATINGLLMALAAGRFPPAEVSNFKASPRLVAQLLDESASDSSSREDEPTPLGPF